MTDIIDAIDAILEPEPFTREQAEEVTHSIRTSVSEIVDLISLAYQHRIWLALDYADWNAYIEGEFGTSPLALPREKRQHAVQSLTAMGLTTRAIAAVTGASKGTVYEDQRSTAQESGTRTADDEPVDVEEAPLPDDKTGLDGRTYSKSNRKKVTDMIEANPKMAPRDIAIALNMEASYVRGVVFDVKAKAKASTNGQAAQPKPLTAAEKKQAAVDKVTLESVSGLIVMLKQYDKDVEGDLRRLAKRGVNEGQRELIAQALDSSARFLRLQHAEWKNSQ